MKLEVESVHLNEVKVIRHQVFEDERGYFMEVFHRSDYETIGLPGDFLQINRSGSKYGVVRGLHFQYQPPMAKLMTVVSGRAFLVAVDIRYNSPTLGQWFGIEIAAEDRKQLWAPAGFARGFCVLSEFAEIQYFCTSNYTPSGEAGICWNDPEINIRWPVHDPIVSARDANAVSLTQWLAKPEAKHFSYP